MLAPNREFVPHSSQKRLEWATQSCRVEPLAAVRFVPLVRLFG